MRTSCACSLPSWKGLSFILAAFTFKRRYGKYLVRVLRENVVDSAMSSQPKARILSGF